MDLKSWAGDGGAVPNGHVQVLGLECDGFGEFLGAAETAADAGLMSDGSHECVVGGG